MDQPLLVLSDAHLSKDYGSEINLGLKSVLSKYRDCEVVLAGDIFDLSLDHHSVPASESLAAAVAPHPEVVAALRRHVQAGGKLTFVPGNHDAGLGDTALRTRLLEIFGAENERSLEVAPWFLRRGRVHIEHGHLYDPDCAPNHPLAPPNPRSEGLGTALMRRFVAPHDAFLFAHANQTTPASGLKKAYEHWGAKTPLVVLDYFRTALSLCFEGLSKKRDVSEERAEGHAALSAYAAHSGVAANLLDALLDAAPRPTHHSFRSTFFRLYFDRVFAASSLGTGLSLLSTAGLGLVSGASIVGSAGALSSTGALLAALGGGYLTASTKKQKNRYGDKVIGQLASAAQLVQQITDCELVVFGHTHVEVNEPNYINLGSFGYGRTRRPFLLIDQNGRPEKAYEPIA